MVAVTLAHSPSPSLAAGGPASECSASEARAMRSALSLSLFEYQSPQASHQRRCRHCTETGRATNILTTSYVHHATATPSRQSLTGPSFVVVPGQPLTRHIYAYAESGSGQLHWNWSYHQNYRIAWTQTSLDEHIIHAGSEHVRTWWALGWWRWWQTSVPFLLGRKM